MESDSEDRDRRYVVYFFVDSQLVEDAELKNKKFEIANVTSTEF